MDIDRGTLLDLGIVDETTGDRDVLSFVDHTWLPESREQLRKMLESPLSSASAIEARQRDLQAIAAMATPLPPFDIRRAVDTVELYLIAKRPPLPRHLVSSWILGSISQERARSVLGGLRAARRVILFAASICDALDPVLPPAGELHGLQQGLRAAIDVPSLRRLASCRWDGMRLVTFDYAIRGDAKRALGELIALVRRFDAMQSLARLGCNAGFSYPEVVEAEQPFVMAEGVFHPTLAHAIPNDVTIGTDAPFMFLTGPNMAGKSTYLKACAILVVLAHAGTAVPAKRARLSVFDRVFASLTVRDSVRRGESYYLAEVRRVGQLVQFLLGGQRVFSIIDEAFKGTNVHDASEATALLASSIARCGSAVTLLASHLAELADGLASLPEIQLRHFDAVLCDDGIRRDFRLRPGASKRRLGMHILMAEGIASGLETLKRDGR